MTECRVLLSLFLEYIIRETRVLGPNEDLLLSAVVLGPNY